MMAVVDRSAASAVLLCLCLAGATARSAPAAPAPVELVEPRPGSALPAGGVAAIAWAPREAGEGRSLEERGFEEWEAFLSLDGGAHYPVRLTPHLALAVRRFHFQVPAIPSADVRILLRMGDEVSEHGFELPHRFTIAAVGTAPPVPVLPAAGRGEAPRPGDAGVVTWVEGSRRGDRLLRRSALPASSGTRPARRWAEPGRASAGLVPRTSEATAPSLRLHPEGGAVPSRGSPRSVVPPSTSDVLLRTGRRNE